MAQQAMAGRTRAGGGGAWLAAAPELSVRLVGALLALAISAVHVADQGSITALASPDWIGWGYRLIEVGGVLTAVTLLLPWTRWLGWAAGLLLGFGPFAGYLLSRSVGVPGDPGDVGNWGYWVGTVSLVVEAALMVLCAGMLLAYWRAGAGAPDGGSGQSRSAGIGGAQRGLRIRQNG
jgi:hypothetical protein